MHLRMKLVLRHIVCGKSHSQLLDYFNSFTEKGENFSHYYAYKTNQKLLALHRQEPMVKLQCYSGALTRLFSTTHSIGY